MDHSHHGHEIAHNHHVPNADLNHSGRQHVDHDKHAGHSVALFRNKFWICLILTVPVLVYSPMIQEWLRFSAPELPGSHLIPFIFGTIIFFYGGWVFLNGAARELKTRLPGMMTLIALAITVAFVYSVAVQLLALSGEPFFWELATLVTIMLLGHWLEMASISKAQNALEAIKKLLPDKADKLIDGKPRTVLVSELKVNDLVLVRPGATLPADGEVVDGESTVNEAAISGESKPVTKQLGDKAVAGTINQDGSLTIKIAELGENTALAGIMRLVAEAQASKSNAQMLADKAALVLTITAISAGLITFVVWALLRDVSFALERSVTVLVIACPHALGLAIPLVVAISTAISARNGLLVRKRLALENARNLDIILFDKTGTLTRGEHGVTDIWAVAGFTKNQILQLTASLEQNSEHIVGRGIVSNAVSHNLQLISVKNFKALPGLGVIGQLDGKNYVAASHRYIQQQNISVPNEIAQNIRVAAKQGKTEVYLIQNGQVIGAIALADLPRQESKIAIQDLKAKGIKVAMVTGDSQEVAAYIAKQLGLDDFIANVRPEGKAGKIKELQAQGQKVGFVGDGINDAPALTTANIGIAIGAGADVAIKSADIVLVKSDPRDVAKVVSLSKATYRKMWQNLLWATGYNIVAIPLAAGVLSGAGILLSPAVGAVFMSLSTIIVALNAQLLRRSQL